MDRAGGLTPIPKAGCCVSLDKVLSLSKPQISHLCNGHRVPALTTSAGCWEGHKGACSVWMKEAVNNFLSGFVASHGFTSIVSFLLNHSLLPSYVLCTFSLTFDIWPFHYHKHIIYSYYYNNCHCSNIHEIDMYSVGNLYALSKYSHCMCECICVWVCKKARGGLLWERWGGGTELAGFSCLWFCADPSLWVASLLSLVSSRESTELSFGFRSDLSLSPGSAKG